MHLALPSRGHLSLIILLLSGLGLGVTPVSSQHTALVWHACGSSFIYEHAIRSLVRGLEQLGRFSVVRTPNATATEIGFTPALSAAVARLRAGDLFLFVGDGGQMEFVALARRLRARRVALVHYQTEPSGRCFSSRDGLHEQWDYSWWADGGRRRRRGAWWWWAAGGAGGGRGAGAAGLRRNDRGAPSARDSIRRQVGRVATRALYSSDRPQRTAARR